MPDYVPMFDGWLPALSEDSTRVFGRDPSSMNQKELQEHLRTMGVALMVECAELIEETQWKGWKKVDEDRFPLRNSRLILAREAVDVLHFLAHLLNACGVTENDLNYEMMLKRQVNEERQSGEYGY